MGFPSHIKGRRAINQAAYPCKNRIAGMAKRRLSDSLHKPKSRSSDAYIGQRKKEPI